MHLMAFMPSTTVFSHVKSLEAAKTNETSPVLVALSDTLSSSKQGCQSHAISNSPGWWTHLELKMELTPRPRPTVMVSSVAVKPPPSPNASVPACRPPGCRQRSR